MIQVYKVEKDNYEDAGMVSSAIKQTLKQLGCPPKLLRQVAIACYEGEINLVIHSNGGTIAFEINDEGVIDLKLDDVGPGIEDLQLAMTPGYSTASKKARDFGFGAGMGLDNMKHCASTFEINSSKEGTHIHMTFI